MGTIQQHVPNTPPRPLTIQSHTQSKQNQPPTNQPPNDQHFTKHTSPLRTHNQTPTHSSLTTHHTTPWKHTNHYKTHNSYNKTKKPATHNTAPSEKNNHKTHHSQSSKSTDGTQAHDDDLKKQTNRYTSTSFSTPTSQPHKNGHTPLT